MPEVKTRKDYSSLRQIFQNIKAKVVRGALQSDNYAAGVSGLRIDFENGTGEFVTLASGAFIKTFAQASIPVSVNVGDIWIDTDDNNRIYRAASVGADQIAAGEWIELNPDIEWPEVLNGAGLKPANNATVGATAGTNLRDSGSVVLSDTDVKNINGDTAGEAINASTTPQSVYKDDSDGKLYLTDANDTTLGHRRFYGFVGGGQNLAANASAVVQVQGVVTGFPAATFTAGKFAYLSETAGAVTQTAPGSTVVLVGVAVSATEVLILKKGIKQATGSISKSCSSSNLTTTVTVGFRVRLVHVFSVLNGNDSGSACNGETTICAGAWSDSSGQNGVCMNAVGQTAQSIGTSVGDTEGSISVSVGNITDTAFDIVLTIGDPGTPGVGNVGKGDLFYVAFAE